MLSDKEATEVGLEGPRGCMIAFALLAVVCSVVLFIIYTIAS